MHEPELRNGAPPAAGRPFPWFCPKCRRKEVRSATIPYRCERLHEGRLVTVEVPNLVVPRCDHCGELVFNYTAEEMILQALATQSAATAHASLGSRDGQS